jgi:two-component system response regulator AtoC
VVASTNRDLEAMVSEGAFREDLFYRLNVVSIQLPPLRERKAEIPLLAEHFLQRYAAEYARAYAPPSEAFLEVFTAYHWPGNVRELENLVKRRVVLGSETPVLQEIAARTAQPPPRRAAPSARSAEAVPDLDQFLRGELESVSLKRVARQAARVAERRVIERVLNRTRWNRKEAAEILQISYKALLYKMKEAGLADTP